MCVRSSDRRSFRQNQLPPGIPVSIPHCRSPHCTTGIRSRPRRRFCEPCKPSVLDDWPDTLFESLRPPLLRSKERRSRSLKIANRPGVSAGRRSYAADKSTPYAWPPTAADRAVIFASEHRSKIGITSPPCRSAADRFVTTTAAWLAGK